MAMASGRGNGHYSVHTWMLLEMDPGKVLFSFPSWFLLIIIALLTIYLLTCLFPKPKIDVQGKFVLITGCDSGFGRATAIQLDKMGACVLATCLTKEGEQSLKSVASDRLKTFQLDVTNSQQIKDVYKVIKEEISSAGLWELVNNAGILYLSPIEWTPLDVFKRTADVNLWGMIDVTKTFLPLVKKSKGRVVNLSSMSGRLSANCYGSYSVSKYGVEAFSDALRREMYPWGIKVSMLEPGSFSTNICAPDMFEKQLREGWDRLSDKLKAEYGEEYLNKVIEIVKKIHRTSDVNLVVNKIVDGLTSASPPDRYIIGQDAWFVLLPLTYLPAFVADFLLRVGFKIPSPQGCLK